MSVWSESRQTRNWQPSYASCSRIMDLKMVILSTCMLAWWKPTCTSFFSFHLSIVTSEPAPTTSSMRSPLGRFWMTVTGPSRMFFSYARESRGISSPPTFLDSSPTAFFTISKRRMRPFPGVSSLSLSTYAVPTATNSDVGTLKSPASCGAC